MTDPADALRPRRRAVLAAAGLTPLAALLPGLLAESRARAATGSAFRFLSPHQAAVVTAATARLVPGPTDDPTETGHPGAREANVVRYIDTLLSVFDDDPPKVFAGGPWSNRHAPGSPDYAARFVPLQHPQLLAWKRRVADLRRRYVAAVKTLDQAAGGDFTTAPAVEQDRILTQQADVRALLFTNTIEGLYALPEYGGNAGLSAWREIGWPGDVQPVGYTPAEVERDDGPDPVGANELPVVEDLLKRLPVAARFMVDRGWPRGR